MRYLTSHLMNDLRKKMVLLSGPRQCGKTTLAKSLMKKNSLYLNWDDPDQRKTIFNRDWSDRDELLVLDELHKFPKWKSWLKGSYDTQKDLHKFLVTGSARLEVFKKGGDSLMGRYHHWHLHPFSLCEIPKSSIGPDEALRRLLKNGGFPEPFLDNDERESRRWRRERFEKVIKQDIRELEVVQDIVTMGLLVDLLRERVGSPIVISNLAQDLQKSPVTIKKWIELLESMYILFRVRPYTHKVPRSLQKPFKVFFFDNADVDGDQGAKFENLVATHLLKQTQYAQDFEGHSFELAYIRDKDQREVDFVVLKNKLPIELIEVKLTELKAAKDLVYYAEKLKIPKARQIVLQKDEHFRKGKLEVIDARIALSKVEYFFDP